MQNLPPLNGFRAFVSVANHMSFSAASKELSISRSGVSHHIKSLEVYFGFQLFHRHVNKITLTIEGEKMLPSIVKAFELITDVVDEITKDSGDISVHMTSSFAISWMMPKFFNFEARYPKINVNISEGPESHIENKYYDLKIVYSESSMEIPPLIEEWMIPVCSPDYFNSNKISIKRFSENRLLLNSRNGMDWKAWSKSMKIDGDDFDRHVSQAMKLSTDSSAIEMAISGLGIALANVNYVTSELTNKTLVPALPVTPFLLGAHYLDYKKHLVSGATLSLIKWLQSEGEKSKNFIIEFTEALEINNI
ncbi:MAG: LysR substrate-binding domain-containing protein [Hyphomicrobiales bacterium]